MIQGSQRLLLIWSISALDYIQKEILDYLKLLNPKINLFMTNQYETTNIIEFETLYQNFLSVFKTPFLLSFFAGISRFIK